MTHAASGTTIHVSTEALQQKMSQATEYLELARYRQAVRLLSDLLKKEPLGMIDQLYVLAQRAVANALWKKPEAAIEDASQLLAAVKADVNDLPHDMDWKKEHKEDVGHLRFLADVLQLRGVLYRLIKSPRAAVEDLSLSAYMTREETDNTLNYVLRAGALIELGDCLEQAQRDLDAVWTQNKPLFYEWLDLPEVEQAHFELDKKRVYFVSEDHRIALKPDKVKLKKSKLTARWFRLCQLLHLDL